jgi:hypothetical protein
VQPNGSDTKTCFERHNEWNHEMLNHFSINLGVHNSLEIHSRQPSSEENSFAAFPRFLIECEHFSLTDFV